VQAIQHYLSPEYQNAASNEHFFSVLKRVKTYLRTTMGDECLSHLMLMNIENPLSSPCI